MGCCSSSSSSSAVTNRRTIHDLSDTVCIIYTYLEQRDQGSLRQTCLTAAERFDQMVELGWVAVVGSDDIAAWESRRQSAYDRAVHGSSTGRLHRWQWFPVARRRLSGAKRSIFRRSQALVFKRSIEVLQVNVDLIALNSTFRSEWGIEMTSDGTAAASNGFLAQLAAVRRVFFHESKLLELVGDNFLRDCPKLLTIDIHGLSALITVEDRWLSGCSSLTTISFDGLGALSTVRDCWLFGCTSLTTISFEGLGALTAVGSHWLAGCTSLATISYDGLAALTTVRGAWLYGCTSLTAISFDGLAAVTTVGGAWLYGCTSLTAIIYDASSLPPSMIQKLKKVTTASLQPAA